MGNLSLRNGNTLAVIILCQAGALPVGHTVSKISASKPAEMETGVKKAGSCCIYSLYAMQALQLSSLTTLECVVWKLQYPTCNTSEDLWVFWGRYCLQTSSFHMVWQRWQSLYSSDLNVTHWLLSGCPCCRKDSEMPHVQQWNSAIASNSVCSQLWRELVFLARSLQLLKTNIISANRVGLLPFRQRKLSWIQN